MHDYKLQIQLFVEATVFVQLLSVATIILSIFIFIVWINYKYKKSRFSKFLKKFGNSIFYCGMTFLVLSTIGIILDILTKRLTYSDYISIVKGLLDLFL